MIWLPKELMYKVVESIIKSGERMIYDIGQEVGITFSNTVQAFGRGLNYLLARGNEAVAKRPSSPSTSPSRLRTCAMTIAMELASSTPTSVTPAREPNRVNHMATSYGRAPPAAAT